MGWRSLAREGIAACARASGVPLAVRALNRRRATVIMYHDPRPEHFEAHLRFYQDHYNFVSYDRVVEAVVQRDAGALPDRALALTFDDGWVGNYALLPLFRRYGVRPLIFVCSAIVGTRRGFWFNEDIPVQPLKRLRNSERLDVLKRMCGFEPMVERPGPRQALSREEILAMAPHVDFGSHTRTHPILTQCSDEEAFEEIAESRHELEALLGAPVRHFCYPNGDFGDREVEFARRAGYASARTTDVGATGPATNPFRIPVGPAGDDSSVPVLASQIVGLPRYAKNAAQGRLSGKWTQQPVARA